jgi:hypothetical protein
MMESMARGWQSKNIEEQQGEAERQRTLGWRPVRSAEQIARDVRREGLQLSRARMLASLQTTSHGEHRALLERTLAHIDSELAALEDSRD